MADFYRLLKLCRPYALWLMLGIFLSLASVLANVALMAVSGSFITAMGLAGVAGVSINYFTPAAIIRGCAIVRTAGRYAERLVTHEGTLRLIAGLRSWLFNALEPLAPAVLGRKRSGDVLSRMRCDLDTLERFYLNFLVPVSVAIIAGIVFLIFLCSYSVSIALLVGAFMILSGFAVPLVMRIFSCAYEQKTVEVQADLRAELAANLQGMGELLVYDTKRAHEDRIMGLVNDWSSAQVKTNLFSSFSGSFVPFAATLSMGGTLYIALSIFESGQIKGADVAMLTLFSLAAFEVILPLPAALQSFDSVLISARRIFSLVDQDTSVREPAEPEELSKDFDLEFSDVRFSYEESLSYPALDGVSFHLSAGEKMAIVGPTGVGKSSIINLLCRFWELQRGQILLGGKRVEEYALEDVRRCFAVLPQRPYLFAASIEENLRIAAPEASKVAIEDVCMKAGLHDFIVSQPKGYDTFVGENGAHLSGGQIRRLALARALLKGAPCLVLDEPGEGLDYETERDILTRVIENLGGASFIMITHRNTGLDLMDKILQMEA